MKVFVAILACVVVAAAHAGVQQPDSYLQPPVEYHTGKEFNAPWVEKNTWEPEVTEVQLPVHAGQSSANFVQQGYNHYNPSAVAVQVNHPYWATSFSNIHRYDTQWPTYTAAPVAATAPVYVAAPMPKPSPVVVYNNVAKWNPWNNYQAQHTYAGYGAGHAKAPLPVAKYIAITPGSVHIAPLPGHTVSQKILNLAPAGSW